MRFGLVSLLRSAKIIGWTMPSSSPGWPANWPRCRRSWPSRWAGRFRTFDAVAILGTTNQAVRIIDLPADFVDAAGQGAESRQRLVETILDGFPDPYLESSRGPLLSAFHLDDVPVFLAFGDVDVSPCPHLEPSTYPASRDVTLFLLPSSAHCHNMATSRQVLWDRLEAWAATVA